MAQTKILLDSNAYFRLAQNIHPLLFQSFGEEQFTLYVHNDLTREFKRSSRLRNKFDWVYHPEYVENRKRSLTLSKAERQESENTYDYMWEHVKADNLGPSEVDVKVLATAAAVGIQVVTDDADMIQLADAYGIHSITSMELMKLMLDHKHIDMDKVEQVVEQWMYDKDLPNRNFTKDYKRLFGRKPPKPA